MMLDEILALVAVVVLIVAGAAIILCRDKWREDSKYGRK